MYKKSLALEKARDDKISALGAKEVIDVGTYFAGLPGISYYDAYLGCAITDDELVFFDYADGDQCYRLPRNDVEKVWVTQETRTEDGKFKINRVFTVNITWLDSDRIEHTSKFDFSDDPDCSAQAQASNAALALNAYVKSRPAPAVPELATALETLGRLVKEGIITDEEFVRAKALYLGKPAAKREQACQLLRQLHALYESGVLSKGEFNLKKWDILSKPSGL